MLELLLNFSELLSSVPHASYLIFVLCSLVLDRFFLLSKRLLANHNLIVVFASIPLSLLSDYYLFCFHLEIKSILH